MNYNLLFGHETKCKICGKLFYPNRYWVYKYKGKRYCSYTCWRTAGGGQSKMYEIDYGDDEKWMTN